MLLLPTLQLIPPLTCNEGRDLRVELLNIIISAQGRPCTSSKKIKISTKKASASEARVQGEGRTARESGASRVPNALLQRLSKRWRREAEEVSGTCCPRPGLRMGFPAPRLRTTGWWAHYRQSAPSKDGQTGQN